MAGLNESFKIKHLFSPSPVPCAHSSPPSPLPSPSLLPPPSRMLAHVFDPELDQSNAREFVIYACPQGTLGRQIEDYMETNLCRCGRNGAHKSFPHVTLCQFFKVHHVHTIQGGVTGVWGEVRCVWGQVCV